MFKRSANLVLAMLIFFTFAHGKKSLSTLVERVCGSRESASGERCFASFRSRGCAPPRRFVRNGLPEALCPEVSASFARPFARANRESPSSLIDPCPRLGSRALHVPGRRRVVEKTQNRRRRLRQNSLEGRGLSNGVLAVASFTRSTGSAKNVSLVDEQTDRAVHETLRGETKLHTHCLLHDNRDTPKNCECVTRRKTAVFLRGSVCSGRRVFAESQNEQHVLLPGGSRKSVGEARKRRRFNPGESCIHSETHDDDATDAMANATSRSRRSINRGLELGSSRPRSVPLGEREKERVRRTRE